MTVSGSLLSQSKCHSGGLTFPVADARAGRLRAGCHPWPNHKHALLPFHWQTFFPPYQTPYAALRYSRTPFYSWQNMLKQWGWIKADYKNSLCKMWLMCDILAKLWTVTGHSYGRRHMMYQVSLEGTPNMLPGFIWRRGLHADCRCFYKWELGTKWNTSISKNPSQHLTI